MLLIPAAYFMGGAGLLSILMWLVTVGMGLYAFILFVKMAHRVIQSLDLYIYGKNREIRAHYESAKAEDIEKF